MNNYLTNSNQFYFFVKKTYECKRILLLQLQCTRGTSPLCANIFTAYRMS